MTLNYKKIKNIAFWVGLGIYFLTVSIFSAGKWKTLRYNTVKIVIADSSKHQFINIDDVKQILSNNKIRIYGTPLDSLNTLKLEKLIKRNNNVIKTIEVFPTYHGHLFILITQRNPVLRIITYNHKSFYIDEDGFLMPFSTKYISRVPVVTGDINADIKMFSPDFNAASSECKFQREKMIHNLFDVSMIIYRDPFWKKNVEQLVIKNENELLIIPQVGNFIINFGAFENISDKLRYLKIMYKDVLPKVGWNRYREINLSFNHQIVCKKN